MKRSFLEVVGAGEGAGAGEEEGWLVRKLKLALLAEGCELVTEGVGTGAGAGEDPAIMASKLFK